MRLALISDIHANWHALQAIWEDLERQHPDAVYCLGDLVGYGAFPNEVVAFIRQMDIPTVMGNYDEGVGFDMDDCGCAYRDRASREGGQQSLMWTRANTTDENKAFLRGLSMQIRLEDQRPHMLLVHGSPRRINEYLYENRPKESFERLAKLAGTDVLCYGHTHLPYSRQVAKTLFINTGSVGKPKDGDPRAGYVLLELRRGPRPEFRRVAYDVQAAAEAVRQSGLPPLFAEELEAARHFEERTTEAA
jgi:putative phosphoesterase